jgi:hypothetical protein
LIKSAVDRRKFIDSNRHRGGNCPDTPVASFFFSIKDTRTEQENPTTDDGQHKLRNIVIGYSTVLFLILGFFIPFWVQGTNSLEPSWQNAVYIFSTGFLALVGGTVTLANLLGDRNANGLLHHYEEEHHLDRNRVRADTKVGTLIALSSLIVTAIFG